MTLLRDTPLSYRDARAVVRMAQRDVFEALLAVRDHLDRGDVSAAWAWTRTLADAADDLAVGLDAVRAALAGGRGMD